MEILSKFLTISGISLIRYFILAGIPFLIFYKLFYKKFLKAKIQERVASNKKFLEEIGHSILSNLVFIAIAMLLLFTPLRDYTLIYENISDFPTWWIPVSVVLCLVIHDTYFYWMHRTIHQPKLYKRIHFTHHKSVNPSPWASYSFHFFEAILEAMILPILLFVLPLHSLSVFLFTVSSFLINVYGHLGFELAPKWFRNSWLFEVLNTSVHHNLHHSEFNGNYGLYFRIWDRLMKTENPNYVQAYDRIQAKRFGTKKSVGHPNMAITTVLLLVLSLLFASATSPTSIEGVWQYEDTQAKVLIFKKSGKYFGKVLTATNKADNERIKNKTIFLLKDFEKSSGNKYCCGTIFLPKRKITANGSLMLLDKNTLQVKGFYGLLSKKQKLRRVRE